VLLPDTSPYEAEVDPGVVRVCHCTDCQKLTGRAFRTSISSLPGTFRFKSEPARRSSFLRHAVQWYPPPV
jgi:hypothetical protein